jgi:error-prone DNA polymerase
VEVRPVDVLHSDWLSTLEPPGWAGAHQPAVRLGLQQVKGLGEAQARRLVQLRRSGQPLSVERLAREDGLDAVDLAALAAANALAGLAGHRRQQVWQSAALHRAPRLLQHAPVHEAPLALPTASEAEALGWDYQATGLSLGRHPLALLRAELARRHIFSAEQLQAVPGRRRVQACGLVTVRQRPGTAKGTVFVTLEDETGVVNVIVWAPVVAEQREALLGSRLMAVDGLWQREGEVCHLVARRLHNLNALLDQTLGALSPRSRDFH